MKLPHQRSQPARVAVLLATYNGERFLGEQLDTLRAQTVQALDIWASDDGSDDRTEAILDDAAASWRTGTFRKLRGPGKGFAENFRSLILNPDIVSDYYAFCDQDDLWDADKLDAAIAWLEGLPPGQAGVYCSRTRIVDLDGRTTGLSPLFSRAPSFRNAIVQSIAGANTMVLNRAAWGLLAEASRRASFISHDWWTYLVVTGAGGTVHYSAEPRIGYRQHADNLVGSNNGLGARIARYKFLLRGRFSGWMERNLDGLRRCEHLLTEDARDVLARLERVHSGSLRTRLVNLVRSGAYRQSATANLGLYFACLMGKL